MVINGFFTWLFRRLGDKSISGKLSKFWFRDNEDLPKNLDETEMMDFIKSKNYPDWVASSAEKAWASYQSALMPHRPMKGESSLRKYH